MIELYAITEGAAPALPQELSAFVAGALEVVWGPPGDDEPGPEALWAHERAVEALMESSAVLPFRYGTRFPDRESARAAIAARYDELVEALDRVRGCVELSVRAVGAAHADEASSIHERLCALAHAARVRDPLPGELLRAAYLVERDRVPECVACVGALEAQHPDLSLLCTGPWPPYSFASS